ncbi:superfamily II DNA or RNA helicase [Salsuginibacillus halophilus]|uniref:Superfamily II DNA or RNA helicase n=1 Tax=Salsuginibacillus halophilus TaxID=517424 RepID=A0A2P8HL99_9BACI|nr:DEAD/DEAH box helicase [Salsuginibacillus halophilus]PSL46998.1 superfamily II DNA or RNA helicase [Salsuginibacillus halophilus]
MEELTAQLRASLEHGFIDQQHMPVERMRPQLVLNEADHHMLHTLLEELEVCSGFLFSVAFITESGLSALKAKLLDLHFRGVNGKILTSTYLAFNQPKVFRELRKLHNVEVRTTAREGFHAKGYIFQHQEHTSLIVGSSNLTASALKTNYEWNIKLTSRDEGDIVHHFHDQFLRVWEEAAPLTDEWIEAYEKLYKAEVRRRPAEAVAELTAGYETNALREAVQLEPNAMQQKALAGIAGLRSEQARRGLVVSATGTGKTMLAAFDVRRMQPARFLFIAHREQILHKAKETFQTVLGLNEEDVGILSGGRDESHKRYVFATIQTLSQSERLYQEAADAFDYILIDEVHKAGAATYQRVMDHFTPSWLMGMTATPERTDGFNIFEMFDYNIACEIRLQEALEEDMLCPFHYFGVTDASIAEGAKDVTAKLHQVPVEDRFTHILDKIKYYGYAGERVQGLIFCGDKREAHKLSELMNNAGYRTAALTGEDAQEARMQRVTDLEHNRLDYILTVDIFNEGIDIPTVNQVVMLRRTESSIIFVQQLGRGLRKAEGKPFVTVIDFIGNYQNNYLIPVALAGDQSMNKDNLRRYLQNTDFVQGLSVVNFEAVAKEQVYRAVDQTQIAGLRMMKSAYEKLKFRLGRKPMLHDFITHNALDPEVIVHYQRTNYYDFLQRVDPEAYVLNECKRSVLTQVSQEFLSGKRKHELVLLDMLLQGGVVTDEAYAARLAELNCYWDQDVSHSVAGMFDLTFYKQQELKKYGEVQFVERFNAGYQWTKATSEALQRDENFLAFLKDAVAAGLEKSKAYRPDVRLTRFQKYTRREVVKLLNWEKDESSAVFGYRTRQQTTPIFITYDKQDDVSASVAYKDELLSPERLQWFTRNRKTLASEEVRDVVESRERGNTSYIFVKKSDDEGTGFYYLGTAETVAGTPEETTITDDKGQVLSIVKMQLALEAPVDARLYQYLLE